MFNEKKKLSLDDFKAQAANVNTTELMDSIKGGITDSCHKHSGGCLANCPGAVDGRMEP